MESDRWIRSLVNRKNLGSSCPAVWWATLCLSTTSPIILAQLSTHKTKTRPLHPFSNSTILQEKHLRKQNGELAAAAAVTATISFLPCLFFPPLFPFSLFSLFLCILSHSFFVSTSFSPFPRCVWRGGWKTWKEAKNKKEKRERERHKPTLGRLEKPN